MPAKQIPKNDWNRWRAEKPLPKPREAAVESAVAFLDAKPGRSITLTVKGLPYATVTSCEGISEVGYELDRV
jgi:hypothetical protein